MADKGSAKLTLIEQMARAIAKADRAEYDQDRHRYERLANAAIDEMKAYSARLQARIESEGKPKH